MKFRTLILILVAAIISLTAVQMDAFNKFPGSDSNQMPISNLYNTPEQNIHNIIGINVSNIPRPRMKRQSGPIELRTCNFFIKENAKDHHTIDYDLLEGEDPSPVLRRAQPFKMAMTFNRPFNSDRITVQLTLGSKNVKERGPPVNLPVTHESRFTKEPSDWDIRLSSLQENVLHLEIQIASTAGVGIWHLRVNSSVEGDNLSNIGDCHEDIYILFNPWSENDQVYMENDTHRQEYVLNDLGYLYQGSFSNQMPKSWNFGQFDRTVLPASVYLLEKAHNLPPYLDFASRGDPIKVVQAVALMMSNSTHNDYTGVLVGRWNGSYADGTHPVEWTGSGPILREYMESGGIPVKYAQCWIFCGLFTTICRALGIATRSVTNFSSATDKDRSLTLDTYLDNEASPTPKNERFWNYHTWNDCWMARPDLPPKYSGWQAIDSTIARSNGTEGKILGGPASLLAIREGNVTQEFDASYFFSAVNADEIYWKLEAGQPPINMKKNINNVGKALVTKSPLQDTTEDISHLYKAKEGTPDERRIYYFAKSKLGFVDTALSAHKDTQDDVFFKLMDIQNAMIGQSVSLIFRIENKSKMKRTIDFAVSICSANRAPDGKSVTQKIKSDGGKFSLQPQQQREIVINATPDEYLDKVAYFEVLKSYAYATVEETHQTWADESDFQFFNPPLRMEFQDKEVKPRIGEPLTIRFSFKNPLNIPLENMMLTFEGPGLVEYTKRKLGNLGAGEWFYRVETFTPWKAGSRRISAVLHSRRLNAVLGILAVQVAE